MPLASDARHALDVYFRHHPKAGDVPLLPSNAEPHLACGKILAGRLLSRAEKLAKLPKLARRVAPLPSPLGERAAPSRTRGRDGCWRMAFLPSDA